MKICQMHLKSPSTKTFSQATFRTNRYAIRSEQEKVDKPIGFTITPLSVNGYGIASVVKKYSIYCKKIKKSEINK